MSLLTMRGNGDEPHAKLKSLNIYIRQQVLCNKDYSIIPYIVHKTEKIREEEKIYFAFLFAVQV